MADRATTLSGSFMKVTLGPTTKVLGAGKYSMSGVTRRTVDVSEFGVDIDIFEFDSADGGTVTLTDVNYDPTDAAQETLQNAALNRVKLAYSPLTSGLRLWINSSSYFQIGTSGHVLMTNSRKLDADRNGVGKTSLEGKVSGAAMFLK